MPLVEKALVVRHREVVPLYYELEFIAPRLASEVLPGQFVHVRVTEGYDPLLRRPFSIYNVDKRLGTITVFYKIVGRGTTMLSTVQPSTKLDVMGPLGKPFTVPQHVKFAYLVGGGVGIAPLVYLARVLTDNKKKLKVLLGASTTGFLAGKDILDRLKLDYMVSTDDGSEGMKGRVTDLFANQLEDQRCDYIYACGPEPMLARVNEIALEHGIPGEVSLEEHMACGVGACLGCSHRTKNKEGTEKLSRVCCDGPVFNIGEVVFPSQDAGVVQ